MNFETIVNIILIAILEIFLVFWMTYYSIKNKKIFSKKNFRYMLVLFVIAFISYYTGYKYQFGEFDLPIGFFECIDGCMKALSFRIERDFVDNLVKDSHLFAVELGVCTTLGGITSLFTIFSFFRNFLVNKFLLLLKLNKKDIDVVVGNTAKGFKYCVKNNNECILWIDSNNEELSDKDKEKLYNNRIAYIYKPLVNKKKYDGDELYNVSNLIKHHKHVYFIYFDNEEISNKGILDLLKKLCDVKNDKFEIDWKQYNVIDPINNLKDYEKFKKGKDFYLILDSSNGQYDSEEKKQEKIKLLKNSKIKYEFINIEESKEFNLRSHKLYRELFDKLNNKESYFAIEPYSKELKPETELYLKKAYYAKKKVLKFFIESSGKYTGFMDEQFGKIISNNCDNRKYSIAASSFYLYDLLARNFSIEKNFADYLPKDFFEDDIRSLVKKDKNINVVLMGLGRTNEAMFKTLLINNQFIAKGDDETYSPKLVNYYIYEKDNEVLNNSLITYIEEHNKNHKQNGKLRDYYNLCDLKTKSNDVFGKDFYNDIRNISNTNNSFTFIFINCESGVSNSAFAANLSRLFNKNNAMIFYVVNNHNFLLDMNDSDILEGFGFKEELLTHDKINNQDLYDLAGSSYVRYIKLKDTDYIPVDDLDSFTQMSNLYANMNIKFKLRLLGLKLEDVDPNNSQEVYESLLNYYEIYDPRIYNVLKNNSNLKIDEFKFQIDNAYAGKESIFGNLYDYNSYFRENIRSSLSYQEHLRWNAFHIVNGYLPLDYEDIYYRPGTNGGKGKGIHKNMICKKHACITAYNDLDLIAERELELALLSSDKNSISKKDFDLYQYDYSTMDMLPFSLLNVLHPKKIVKINEKKEK